MKKTLLSLVAAGMCLTAGASSLHLTLPTQGAPKASLPGISAPMRNTNPSQQGPMRAEDNSQTLHFTYAQPDENQYGAIHFNGAPAGTYMSMAMCIPPSMADQYAGCTISAIDFMTGGSGRTNTNPMRDYTVFMTYDLTAEPFYTAKVTAPSTIFTTAGITLDSPYTIEAGKELYIGCYVAITDGTYDYPIVLDGVPTENIDGGWIGYRIGETGAFTYQNAASSNGSVVVGCTINGNLPNNIASLDAAEVLPVVETDTPFDLDVLVTNRAANVVNNVTIRYSVGDEPAVEKTVTLSKPLSFNASDYVTISGVTSSTATPLGVDVKAELIKVNGEDNTSSMREATANTTIIPKGQGYTRNILMEEATSIYCQYCPVGIVGMEYAAETYTDGSFSTVSIHSQFGGRTDPMEIPSYGPYLNEYVTGFPSSTFNRIVEVYPHPQYIAAYYSLVRSIPSLAELDLQCQWTDESKSSIKFDSKVRGVFDFDGNAPYRLCYVITEDYVGPYRQLNGFAGGANGELDGWEKKGSSVLWRFDDVARLIDDYQGISGSVPAVMEAGKDYEYSHTVTLPKSVSGKAVNPDKVNAICFILNTRTGFVENVVTVKNDAIAAAGDSAIKGIEADNADAPVEYFNLQGQRVENPSQGLYIRRQGTNVEKVVIR